MWWRRTLSAIALCSVPLALVVRSAPRLDAPPPVTIPTVVAPSVVAPTPSVPPSPEQVIAAFEDLRADAYADPAHADPALWLSPRCACLAEESRRLHDLASRGESIKSGGPQVREITVEMSFADGWRLLLVDVVEPYEVLDAQGQPMHRYAGRGPARWRVEIRNGLVTEWLPG